MLRRIGFKQVLTGILLLSIGIGVLAVITTEFEGEKEIKDPFELPSWDLTPHVGFVIDHNNDFLTYGLPGEGTEGDPYRIENFNITGSISITDVSKYFLIQNCYVKGGGSGIVVINSPYVGRIENNYVDSSTYGITIRESGKSTIINNTITNVFNNNIWLDYSAFCTVADNRCKYNIRCEYSIYSNITNNYVIGGNIFLRESSYSLVTNNTCIDTDGSGIQIENSSSVLVKDNICNNCRRGILVQNCDTIIVEGNTCNNNDPEYGIGVVDSPFTVVTNNTCDNNLWYSIAVHSSDYSNVTYNSCYNNTDSFSIGSDYCLVTYNEVEETAIYGIEVLGNNNTIHHNNFIDNAQGLSPQGLDDGLDNVWIDTINLEGNFWDDWLGFGTYALNGTAGTEDLYPLSTPVQHPVIPEYSMRIKPLYVLSLLVIMVRIVHKKKKTRLL